MNNVLRNTVVAIVGLAAISMLGRNFSGAAATTSTAPARQYYLTKAVVNGDRALTACASGYHFASFAEIMDPAVLTYNKTLGRSSADDGAGPPSLANAIGWVRSGFSSNSQASTRTTPTNCSLWTSGASTDVGEIGGFNPSFGGTTTAAPVVEFVNNVACDNSQGLNVGVWCVEN